MSAHISLRGDVGVALGALWLGLGVGALVLLAAADGAPLSDVPLDVSGWWLVPAFALCEVLALRVERRQGQIYGFALAEVPLAIGLLYADPAALVAGRVVAVALVLAVMHRRIVEVAFELAVTAVQTLIAVALYVTVLGDASPVGLRGAAALVAGLLASHLVAVGAVMLVVVMGGWPDRRSVRQLVRSGTAAAALDGAIGLGLALALWRVPHAALIVIAAALACLWANHFFTRLAVRNRRLETIQDFLASLERSMDLSEIAESVLRGSCSALRADSAAVLLAPVSDLDDALRVVLTDDGVESRPISAAEFTGDLAVLVPDRTARALSTPPEGTPAWLADLSSGGMLTAPLTNANGEVTGALVLSRARRARARGFGEGQAQLLGDLAGHASMALESGVLFARLQREAQVRAHQALHDPLTDLPNKFRLNELLNEAIEAVYAVRGRVGLLVIDLDEFSQISDAFGHASTDELLVQACRRIRGLLPAAATLCRIGTNEFAAILPDVSSVDEAIGAARMLIAGFDPPFQVEGVLLALGVNIGVAVYPEHAVDVPSLTQRAHIARDTARRLRSGWEAYDPMHDPSTPRRLALGAELREALEAHELDVCYQPKVEIRTGLVRGAEALVRWNHRRLGRVRPAEFIAVAEHTGDIRHLTMVVMRQALAQCRSWRDRGMDMSVAVNLSARNLLDLHLVDDVSSLIESMGVPPEALTLELTESMVMSESQRSVTVLQGLDDLGVCLSCDDFGTGYSSLTHLRRLPIGEIKVDRSFIARMTVDESDRAIARSVLALGRDLGLTTVAEGVESHDGWELLTELGCDLAQGFYVCPPLTADQFDQWLSQREVAAVAHPSSSSLTVAGGDA